jgi:hypothetical protein
VRLGFRGLRGGTESRQAGAELCTFDFFSFVFRLLTCGPSVLYSICNCLNCTDIFKQLYVLLLLWFY